MADVKTVDLLHYLPPFLQEYRELYRIMETENPEFQLVADEIGVIQDNEYIITCDETGISRFESLLGITPSSDDSLEARISRVLLKWNDYVPYSYKVLIQKLTALCGGDDFTLTPDWNNYALTVVTHLRLSGQVDGLDELLKTIIPCNIEVTSQNELEQEADSTAYGASAVATTKHITIKTKTNTQYTIPGVAYRTNTVATTKHIIIS